MIPLLNALFTLFLIPNVLFYFYCRGCFTPNRWYWSLAYTALYGAIAVLKIRRAFPDFFTLFLMVAALALFGMLVFKRSAAQSFLTASLVFSLFSLAGGVVQSVEYWIAAGLPPEHGIVMKYIDLPSHITGALIFAATFSLLLKFFSTEMKDFSCSGIFLLAVPAFFIALVEQTVSHSIYGSTVVWDSAQGLIYPTVNSVSLLLLHLFAYIGMCSAMAAYQKFVRSLQNDQIIRLLELQAREQKAYVREAQARYRRTRSFRHDLKNHLAVIRELLAEGELEKAGSYLSALDELSESLAPPVKSNNAFVDALLGSKLQIAEQQGIPVVCELFVPDCPAVSDLDWCIILANAVDNAAAANKKLESSQRFLEIHSGWKGNLYRLSLKNGCAKDQKVPEYGIGLSNIEAAVKRNHGVMTLEAAGGVFQLDILLPIPRQ